MLKVRKRAVNSLFSNDYAVTMCRPGLLKKNPSAFGRRKPASPEKVSFVNGHCRRLSNPVLKNIRLINGKIERVFSGPEGQSGDETGNVSFFIESGKRLGGRLIGEHGDKA